MHTFALLTGVVKLYKGAISAVTLSQDVDLKRIKGANFTMTDFYLHFVAKAHWSLVPGRENGVILMIPYTSTLWIC